MFPYFEVVALVTWLFPIVALLITMRLRWMRFPEPEQRRYTWQAGLIALCLYGTGTSIVLACRH